MNGVENNAAPPKAPKSRMSMLLMAVVGIVLLAGAYLAGWSMGAKTGPGSVVGTKGCSESDIVNRLIDSGYLPPEISTDQAVTTLSGTVSNVGGDYVDVSGQLTPIDPVTNLRALVTSNTEIVVQQPKSGAQLQREMNEFDAASASWDPTSEELPPIPPEPVLITPATLSDLTKGMRITVYSEMDMRSGQFEAVRIIGSIQAEQEAENIEAEIEPEEELPVSEEPPVEEVEPTEEP